jgi:GT2 family glycosyltransferase/glycosyltransferase involved in cell wall biosynthesis
VKPTIRDLLRPGGAIAWAAFDRDWYLLTYPEVAGQLASQDFDAVLDFYLGHGQAGGHSPNPFFDEAWYLKSHPEIAGQVRAGAFASGFDQYCQSGYRENDPHWLFDLACYRRNNVDLTEAALQASGHRDHYNHYLLSGVAEGRSAHMFFAAEFYRAQNGAGTEMDAAPGGAFGHYLRGMRLGAAEPRTAIYFDPGWYRSVYPQVTEAIGRGEWRCALHHYLCNETPKNFDPLMDFSESFYLTRHTDVAAAIADGKFDRGYWHFIYNGARELRAPAPAIDLKYYCDHHAAVRQAIADRRVPDAFVHLLTIGRMQGLRTLPPVDEPPEEPQAKALFRLGAANLLPGLARDGIDFSFTGPPDLSIILVVHDHFALTLRALGSIRQNYPGAVELILVDSGSTDETRHIGRYLRGARILAFTTNIGYLRGCNAALNFATADTVLYLNNDIELAPFAIQAALRRLASDPRIGAVGGKVIRTHGRLQEAGCIIWRDGSTQGYLRDASPQSPEANFCREVDFCSAVFLLVRGGLLRELGGFDDAYAPAYFEDADLCVRIALAGYRVVFDPAVVVIHLEYGTAASSLDAQTQMARCHRIFRDKHAAWLETRPDPMPQNLLRARSAATHRQNSLRILFIEDMPPLRLVGSGYVRSNDLIRVMIDLGMEVTVFPVERRRFELAAMFADIPDRVEVMHDCTIEDLPEFLTARAGYYDIVWIGRTHNLDRTASMLPALAGSGGAMPRLILDTEAVAALRDAARAKIDLSADGREEAFDMPAAIGRELANAPLCERVIAVSEDEAQVLRAHGLPRVSVIGHMREIIETSRPWKDRAGMLFVGAIHAMDAPNYDSLCWFVDEVLPLVEQELRWKTRLTIVGYTAPSVDLSRFANHARVTLRGAVADLEPVYNQHRLFVAPTRFAAGIPYKIHSAASYGLPVVATEILRRQLRWRDGAEILTAADTDPAAFARHIVALSRSEALWQTIRAGALARLRAENSRPAYTEAVRAVLAG